MKLTKFKTAISTTAAKAYHGLDELLWPCVCTVCKDDIPKSAGLLCSTCWHQILTATADQYCPTCGQHAATLALIDNKCGSCQNANNHFDAITVAGAYSEALRSLILAFKFNDKTELAKPLAQMAASAFQSAAFRDKIDYLIPVPLHWLRRLHRGYNQAHLIAKGISNTPAKISTDLARIRNTHRQFSLSPAKRRKNVANAFAVRKNHPYKNKNICLIDDITTSRATLNECAKTLKNAGANTVCALVIAIAQP